jgi:hypothetical protein
LHLITESIAELLRKGLCPMLEEERLDDLARLHRLFRRIDAEKALVKALGVCVDPPLIVNSESVPFCLTMVNCVLLCSTRVPCRVRRSTPVAYMYERMLT